MTTIINIIVISVIIIIVFFTIAMVDHECNLPAFVGALSIFVGAMPQAQTSYDVTGICPLCGRVFYSMVITVCPGRLLVSFFHFTGIGTPVSYMCMTDDTDLSYENLQ